MKQPTGTYRNQRLGRGKQRRQHILEVSIRRDKERVRQLRLLIGGGFKLLLAAALCAGLYVGGREAVRRWFWENPALFLTSVRVSTDGSLTREQILNAAGLVTGRNIFTFKPSAIREALNKLPQVEQARVQRNLFNEMEIEVLERQPIAWVVEHEVADPAKQEHSFLVDARGVILKPRRLLPEYDHLPTISGVVYEDLAAGQKVGSLELQGALELLRLTANNTTWQPRHIDISKGYCLVVNDRTKARVTFGVENIDQQLSRFYRLLANIQASQRELRTVNLLVERNTPVTFVEPEPAPEAAPEVEAAPVAPAAAAAEPEPEKPAVAKTTASKEPTAKTANKVKATERGRERSSSSSRSKESAKPEPKSKPASKPPEAAPKAAEPAPAPALETKPAEPVAPKPTPKKRPFFLRSNG